MKLTAKEIARIVGGEIAGNEEAVVTSVASLPEASSQDLTFLGNPKYLKDLPSCQAGILLAKKDVKVEKLTVIYVENPQFAFAKILEIIAQEKVAHIREIHPTAIISKNAKLAFGISIGAYSVIESGVSIGEGTTIGAQCYIGHNSSLGKGCLIHPQAVIREEVSIRDRVIIHSGVVIGSDGFGYVTVGKAHHKIPQIGGVEIEDDVEIGAGVTIDRATIGKTVVGKGTKIDNLVQIAHNVKIGEGCIIVSQAGIAGSSTLGKYVTLAGQVGVVGHVQIGDGVIAAAQSGIPNDVPAGSVIFGSPARPIKEERKIQAIIGRLPDIYEDFRKVKKLVNLDKERDLSHK